VSNGFVFLSTQYSLGIIHLCISPSTVAKERERENITQNRKQNSGKNTILQTDRKRGYFFNLYKIKKTKKKLTKQKEPKTGDIF